MQSKHVSQERIPFRISIRSGYNLSNQNVRHKLNLIVVLYFMKFISFLVDLVKRSFKGVRGNSKGMLLQRHEARRWTKPLERVVSVVLERTQRTLENMERQLSAVVQESMF